STDPAARAGDQCNASLDCAYGSLQGQQWWSECGCGGGTSSAGFRSKNPTGLSRNPAVATGMIGQSSGRGTWWWPNVYQTTTSRSSTGRSWLVQAGSPAPPGCRFG